MSSLMSSVAAQLRPGCPAAMVAALAAVGTLRLCLHGRPVVATEADTVADIRVSTVDAAVVVSVAVSGAAEASGGTAAASAEEMNETATVHPAARRLALASTAGTGTDTSLVGMTATGGAHMTTDATIDVTSVAAAVAATVTAVDSGIGETDAPEATRNLSAAGRVGIATIVTATMTVLLGTTTAESEDTTAVATMNHASIAATNDEAQPDTTTTRLRHLDIRWVVRSPNNPPSRSILPGFRQSVSRVCKPQAFSSLFVCFIARIRSSHGLALALSVASGASPKPNSSWGTRTHARVSLVVDFYYPPVTTNRFAVA